MAPVALSAGMVAAATGGRLEAGAGDAAFAGVSIDSRTLPAGALFVALAGDRFDGHDFLDDAVARGAAGLVVAADRDLGARLARWSASGIAAIAVPDPLAALQALGREVRRRAGTRVIAITGSAGKTTTKEIAADLLAVKYRVYRTRGNLNNHIGLPLSLTELASGADVAVLELGMNHAGEIRTLVGLAEPDVRLWTNVGDAHIGHFGSREAIARAKAEILEGATPGAVLVANADDPLVMAHARGFAGRVVTFGESVGADVRAEHVVNRGVDGTVAVVRTPAGSCRLTVPLVGRAQLANVLAAVAVATTFDVPLPAIEAAVAALRPVARRAEVVALADGVRLVDDSYNASPAAMHAMFAAMAATDVRGRRVAVLGEMLELGDAARALHAETGAAAVAAGIDEIVVVGGPAADGLVEGARAAGLPAVRLHRFADSASAADAVVRLVRAGDLVLVKGSRGTRTDLVADRLRRDAGVA